MQILKAPMLYFALVFVAGFLLGTIRVLLIIPRGRHRKMKGPNRKKESGKQHAISHIVLSCEPKK